MYEFEWDEEKNLLNFKKHGYTFEEALKVFKDPNQLTLYDEKHSWDEARYFCIGNVNGVILTVRFTVRNKKIRIFGAGRWRKGESIYEKRN